MEVYAVESTKEYILNYLGKIVPAEYIDDIKEFLTIYGHIAGILVDDIYRRWSNHGFDILMDGMLKMAIIHGYKKKGEPSTIELAIERAICSVDSYMQDKNSLTAFRKLPPIDKYFPDVFPPPYSRDDI